MVCVKLYLSVILTFIFFITKKSGIIFYKILAICASFFNEAHCGKEYNLYDISRLKLGESCFMA